MATHREQADSVGIVPGAGVVAAGSVVVRTRAQATVQLVGPGVVRAGEPFPELRRLVDQLGTAMRADIVEDADLAVRTADQQQRLAGDLHRARVAYLGQLARDSGEAPTTSEECLLLQLEEGL